MPQRRFLKATLRAHFAQNQPHSNLPRWQSLWSLDTKRERSVASSRTLSTALSAHLQRASGRLRQPNDRPQATKVHLNAC